MNKQTITVQSAGRINLIGEHIDYNDGFVLPAAIDKKTIFQLTKNGTNSQVHCLRLWHWTYQTLCSWLIYYSSHHT